MKGNEIKRNKKKLNKIFLKFNVIILNKFFLYLIERIIIRQIIWFIKIKKNELNDKDAIILRENKYFFSKKFLFKETIKI